MKTIIWNLFWLIFSSLLLYIFVKLNKPLWMIIVESMIVGGYITLTIMTIMDYIQEY